MPQKKIEEIELFAWVGEDEFGSGEIGLKQAQCPAGIIPMVATAMNKMAQTYIVDQLATQSRLYGKTIKLVRFTAQTVMATIEPDGTLDQLRRELR